MYAAFLTVGKLLVGISMNPISIISEAIHSGLDLVAALIAWTAVRLSGQPADDERRHYGHGKFENIAAVIEALLIIAEGVMIIFQAMPRLTSNVPIRSLDLGAFVMGAATAVNLNVSTILCIPPKRQNQLPWPPMPGACARMSIRPPVFWPA